MEEGTLPEPGKAPPSRASSPATPVSRAVTTLAGDDCEVGKLVGPATELEFVGIELWRSLVSATPVEVGPDDSGPLAVVAPEAVAAESEGAVVRCGDLGWLEAAGPVPLSAGGAKSSLPAREGPGTDTTEVGFGGMAPGFADEAGGDCAAMRVGLEEPPPEFGCAGVFRSRWSGADARFVGDLVRVLRGLVVGFAAEFGLAVDASVGPVCGAPVTAMGFSPLPRTRKYPPTSVTIVADRTIPHFTSLRMAQSFDLWCYFGTVTSLMCDASESAIPDPSTGAAHALHPGEPPTYSSARLWRSKQAVKGLHNGFGPFVGGGRREQSTGV